MSTHQPPDGSGLPHPLDLLAPASKREAVIRLLACRRDAILRAWEHEMDRFTVPPHSAPSPALIGSAFDACCNYLQTGATDGLNSLFDRALHHGAHGCHEDYHPRQDDGPKAIHAAKDVLGARATHDKPADTAAQLHHILGSMCLATLPTLMQEYPGDLDAQQEAIALLLGTMDVGVVCVCKALERAVASEVQEAQERQVSFCKEVTRFATRDCLRLVDPDEVPSPNGVVVSVPIREARDGSRLRREAVSVARDTAMEPTQVEDLALAVGEAVSNVLKHAGEGLGHVWRRDETVFVCLSDNGNGITLENLPKALSPGWSTEPSLGMGFTLMLEMADVIWLSTGSYGTKICIEKSATPRELPILSALLTADVPD